jgi:hypothetical protein
MSLSFVKHRIALERRIVGMIVQDAIAQGYAVTVEDEEDIALTMSRDFDAIMENAMAVEVVALHFLKDEEDDGFRRIGAVYLVYGNDGFDVIADHTDNKETRAIIRRAEAYAETAEASEVHI